MRNQNKVNWGNPWLDEKPTEYKLTGNNKNYESKVTGDYKQNESEVAND